MTAAIRIEDLEFAYSPGNTVLKIKNFEVKQGQHVFLHGPSGCGKTTLLGLITGILSSQKGLIEILGTDISQLKLKQRDAFRGNHLGYIFQMFNLIPYLNVRENILLPIKMNSEKRKLSSDPDGEMKNLLSDLELSGYEDRPISELSIGQQQRVAAARSLIGSPKLIVADEPTSALDYDNRERFLDLLFKSADKSGSTILFVSHDHSLAKLFPETMALKTINQAGEQS